MFNKDSCRTCGDELKIIKICDSCGEGIRWLCQTCKSLEGYFHFHQSNIAYCIPC